MQICLSLCEKLDNKFLQQSPHLSWIQPPSNANVSARHQDDPVKLYGTFNFRSRNEFQEGKAFIEDRNKKDIEDRIKEIEEDILRDLHDHRSLLQV
jgi:hypothetical protein